jgi:NAD+ synthase
MPPRGSFSTDLLRIDPASEADRIAGFLRDLVLARFRKRGLIVAISGGVDSAVTAALAVRSLGGKRVFGLLMPERESDADTHRFARLMVESLGIEYACEDITSLLEAAGCYRRRNEAIQKLIPDYTSDCKCKLVLPPVTHDDGFRIFYVVVQYPDGKTMEKRLDMGSYLEIVAATSFKQRCRKMNEYYHADRLNYAVAGTPNRLEYDQGFFVKLGDGAADVKPIAHLYKTQVYELARFLKVPEEICRRGPTTDTYSMPQSQEEFYFSLPYEKMDIILYGLNHGYRAADIGPIVDLNAEQVERVFRDIAAKRRMAAYLHAAPMLVEEVGK